MTRDEMVEALYQRTPLFVPPESFAHTLKGWKLEAVEIHGRPCFITAARGAEFHFCDLGTGEPITRRMIWDFLGPIIRKHGYAMTRTPHDDLRQHRFNVAFGFRATAMDTEFVTYTIKRAN